MQLGINLRSEMLGHVYVVVFGKIRIVLYSLILASHLSWIHT